MKGVYKLALVGVFVGQFAFTNLNEISDVRDNYDASESLARSAVADSVNYYQDTINENAFHRSDYATKNYMGGVDRTDNIYGRSFRDNTRQKYCLWMLGAALLSLLPALGVGMTDVFGWVKGKFK